MTKLNRLERSMDSSALSNAESWLSWIGTAKLIAAFLVAAGVAIEFAGEWVSRPYEKVVKNIRENELSRLSTEAVRLSAEISTANAEAARANENAANANERAAQANLALAQLSQRVKAREIPPDRRAELVEFLKNGPKGKVFVVPKVFDEEAEEFARQIASVLKNAGFDVPDWTGQSPMGYGIPGVFIFMKDLQTPPPHTAHVQHSFHLIGLLLLAYKKEDMADDALIIGISSKP